MMISAVLDTNVTVQSLIGSPRSASARVLDAYYAGKFELLYSRDTLDELIDVLLLPQIRRRHGLSDDEVLEVVASLLLNARHCAGELGVSATLTRDLTDTKFLALAAEADADYLVTNDRRHLLPLGRYERTRVVTPAAFLRQLP
jgi:putative PIN family toxin of toxin-antitoxin system